MAGRITDQLWEEIRELIPRRKRSRKGGRPPVDDRQCLEGIVFVLESGIAWGGLPLKLGYGSGVTCWRRLRAWTRKGVWHAIHTKLLCLLGSENQIDHSHAIIDSASVRAVFGGRTRGRTRQTVGKKAANGMS